MRRWLPFIPLLLFGWLIYEQFNHPTKPAAASRQAEAEQVGSQAREAQATEQAAYELQTRARIEELAKMEAARRDRDRLAIQGTDARLSLQAAKSAAWAALLSTNWQTFQALRKQAGASRTGSAPCVICDGHGLMDYCLLCGHSGKCVTCKGNGKNSLGADCPTCRGLRACFLCLGTGAMPCPFCESGFVRLGGPLPADQMPVLVETPAPQAPQPVAIAASGEPGSSSTATRDSQSERIIVLPPLTPPPAVNGQAYGLAVAVLLAGLLSFRKLTPLLAEFLNRRFNTWNSLAVAATEVSSEAMVEQQTFLAFIAALHAGPGTLSRTKGQAEAGASGSGGFSGPLAEFFAAAPQQFVTLRGLFAEISRTPEEAARQNLVGRLSVQVHALKGASAVKELLPVWQLASGLEGLLAQLASKASNVSASALRTAAIAVDLLENLSVPGLRPDLLTNPPVRLLAVDDDPIIRHAVAFALKKALNQPDLATNGTTALAMAEGQHYDVVFLDVEMPGIEGFELCSKIRATELNRGTPVVFVTSHSDFGARAKSALTGAHDLIAKPFLTFEIAVKALTLVLRARLEQERLPVTEPQPATKTENGAADITLTAASAALPPSKSETTVVPRHSSVRVPASASDTRQRVLDRVPTAAAGKAASEPTDCARAFFAQAPAELQKAREQVQSLKMAVDPLARQKMLSDLCLCLNSLASDADRALLGSAFRLSSTLERLLSKLLQQPKHSVHFALTSAATVLDLLTEICRTRIDPDLANPPLRLLVVDDDPVARRAFSGALQLAFSSPESVDSGEAGLALASQKPFDMIFLDVMMPGMDGFSTCAKVRETVHNEQTPVVFITSHTDDASRAQSVRSGGNGFIPKPALAIEVTLAALTFSLSSRLGKLKPARVAQEAEAAVC